jgi:hypothetical protein
MKFIIAFRNFVNAPKNSSVQVSSGGVIFANATTGVADANQAFGTRFPRNEVRSPFAIAR